MLSVRAAVAGVLQNPATLRLTVASRRQARWSSQHKLARATVLGWTTDGCVESKLVTETVPTGRGLPEEECVKRVARVMEPYGKPTGLPPPIRSLPCLTNACVRTVLAELKEGKRIPLMDAMQILSAAALLLKDEPTVGEVNGKVVVVGDLDGSIGDMLHILETQGLPGEDAHYIFNGDLVDCGNNSCEVLLLALILKLSTPDAVHINRGNHEVGGLNERFGFYDECVAKYNLQFFESASTVFSYLPLAAVVNQRVFVCHGGLFDGMASEALWAGLRWALLPDTHTHTHTHTQARLRNSSIFPAARRMRGGEAYRRSTRKCARTCCGAILPKGMPSVLANEPHV